MLGHARPAEGPEARRLLELRLAQAADREDRVRVCGSLREGNGQEESQGARAHQNLTGGSPVYVTWISGGREDSREPIWNFLIRFTGWISET